LLFIILVSFVDYSYQFYRCGIVTMVGINMGIHEGFFIVLSRSGMSNQSRCYRAYSWVDEWWIFRHQSYKFPSCCTSPRMYKILFPAQVQTVEVSSWGNKKWQEVSSPLLSLMRCFQFILYFNFIVFFCLIKFIMI
jgi:hypothetical protein